MYARPLPRIMIFCCLVFILTGSWSATAQREPERESVRPKRPAVTGVNGLIVSGHSLASMAGARIQMDGGNAADAAVATLATLNLTEPMMSGLGGNGFFTIYDKGSDKTYSLNATGAAPLALDPANVTPDELARGIKAGVVPGLFGGWIRLLERFGTKSLSEVLAPAIEYAEKGHALDPFVASSISRSQSLIERFPSTADVLLPKGRPPLPGEVHRYPALVGTFKSLVRAERRALGDGKSRSEALQAAYDCFYNGEISRKMVTFYKEHDGLFTAEDFARYEPLWTEPIQTRYRGYDVYSTPSTSRGGLEVIMQLNLIEGFNVAEMGHNSAETLHLIAESIKLAKSDIYHFVADPKFTNMPTAGMVSKEYAAERRSSINPKRAMRFPNHGDPSQYQNVALASQWKELPFEHRSQFAEEPFEGSTTSFSIVDQFGNVVVCTPTLGSLWGTGVAVADTGIIFNNGTRIGSTSPYPDDVNYVRGGQIPILNNSPVLVMRDGQFHMSLGTPGGETIGQTEFQVLLNVLDFGMTIQEAVEAPRMSLSADPNFYKPGATVSMQLENGISRKVFRRLKRMGHRPQPAADFGIGSNQGILVNPETETMTAGADPRRMMYAIGW